MESKRSLRKAALIKRRKLTPAQYEQFNDSVCEQVRELVHSNKHQSLHCFLPIKKNYEPDLTHLFPWFWENNVKVMVSKTHFDTKTMTHYWLTPKTRLVKNGIGIPEPVDATPADISDTELILVPLLLGDKSGNRIGYGGGYYDRLLAGFNGYSLGVSFSPLVDELPCDDRDIRLNSILIPE